MGAADRTRVSRFSWLYYTTNRGESQWQKRKREYEKRTGYAAQAKYLKERGKSVAFRLIKPQDNDIIEKLESVSSKAGYIKELIRADIAKDK